MMSSLARSLRPFPRVCATRLAQRSSSGARGLSSSDASCKPITFHKPKSNKFELASSAGAAHSSMGASAVLDGCPVIEDHDDAALLIIDPQVDFHEGGSLAVAGATSDSDRIAAMIRRNPFKIDHIVVSLDAHHLVHIAHGSFWKGASGASPPPLTQILHAEVVAGKWAARDPELQQWALEYTASLEGGGRFTHIIWPDHCRVGTPGFAVSPALMPALDEWSATRQRAVTWVLKGQNNRTEMYSALKAEVPVTDDPATLMNTSLVQLLLSHAQVLVCGQAKSHCVNFTTRDLLSMWPADRVSDLVVLTDATSPVTGFEAAADEFEKDMLAAGVTLTTSDQWQPK